MDGYDRYNCIPFRGPKETQLTTAFLSSLFLSLSLSLFFVYLIHTQRAIEHTLLETGVRDVSERRSISSSSSIHRRENGDVSSPPQSAAKRQESVRSNREGRKLGVSGVRRRGFREKGEQGDEKKMGDEGTHGGVELYDRQIAKDAEPYWPQEKLRICITGAGGFIASHLARRLKNEGHHIIAVDWKRNEHMTVRAPSPR